MNKPPIGIKEDRCYNEVFRNLTPLSPSPLMKERGKEIVKRGEAPLQLTPLPFSMDWDEGN
jgi:hypothetical protein